MKRDAADDGAGLRHLLVEGAAAMLRDGQGEISLRAVARRAGVSAMAPYRHFENKAALLGAVATEGFERLHAVLTAADAEGDARTRLVRQGIAYVRFATDDPALFRLMFADGGAAPKADGCRGQAYDVLAGCVRELAPDEAETAALACWAMVHGIAMLALDAPAAAFEDAHVAAVLGLLAARL